MKLGLDFLLICVRIFAILKMPSNAHCNWPPMDVRWDLIGPWSSVWCYRWKLFFDRNRKKIVASKVVEISVCMRLLYVIGSNGWSDLCNKWRFAMKFFLWAKQKKEISVCSSSSSMCNWHRAYQISSGRLLLPIFAWRTFRNMKYSALCFAFIISKLLDMYWCWFWETMNGKEGTMAVAHRHYITLGDWVILNRGAWLSTNHGQSWKSLSTFQNLAKTKVEHLGC